MTMTATIVTKQRRTKKTTEDGTSTSTSVNENNPIEIEKYTDTLESLWERGLRTRWRRCTNQSLHSQYPESVQQ
jgi:hypothetical protein